GFCLRTGSAGFLVEADSTLIRSSIPSRLMAMRGLRPNGEPKLVRRVSMTMPSIGRCREQMRVGGGFQQLGRARARADQLSTGDDEIDGFRAFAFFVRLDIERDPLPFIQRLEPGSFDGGYVDEHIAPAIVRLDET